MRKFSSMLFQVLYFYCAGTFILFEYYFPLLNVPQRIFSHLFSYFFYERTNDSHENRHYHVH